MSVSHMLVHTFIISPATRYILTNSSKNRTHALIFAMGFLGLVAAASVYVQNQENPPNFYTIMGVPVSASFEDVKRAYKQLSLKLHPDKNPSPTAAADFAYLGAAYETLSDSTARHAYNRFGLNAPKTDSFAGLALHTLTFYIIWVVLVFFLTIGRDQKSGRTYSYAGLLVLLVIEVNMRFSDWDLLAASFPFTPAFEKIMILHQLFPSFMNAVRLLSVLQFVDHENETRKVMFAILASQREIIERLDRLEGKVSGKIEASAEASGASGEQSAEGDAKTADSSHSAASSPQGAAANTAAAARLRPPGPNIQMGPPQPPPQPWYKNRIVIMVGFYLLMNWLSKK